MSPFLPLFPESMVKIWPSRSLHAPCSDALRGMVTKAFLPRPPRPLAPQPPVLPRPSQPALFTWPMLSRISRILFSWDLSASSFCAVLLTALLYKFLVVHRMCWKNLTLLCSFIVNVSVGRAALPGDGVIVILAFPSFTAFYLSFYKLWGKTWGNAEQNLMGRAHHIWVRIPYKFWFLRLVSHKMFY